MISHKIFFLTGGAKSGKSNCALEIANRYKNKAFIATAQPFDAEMKERIARHREERDSSFYTIEEPFELHRALREIPEETDVVVIDCLTVWLGNILHRSGPNSSELREVKSFIKEISRVLSFDVVIVSNELGMGIVPENALSRSFRDQAGLLNQKVANIADTALFVVSGLPLAMKGEL